MLDPLTTLMNDHHGRVRRRSRRLPMILCRRLLAWLDRRLHATPDSPGCRCCHRPVYGLFGLLKMHRTQYAIGLGLTVLCVGCWRSLGSYDRRWPFYVAELRRWPVGTAAKYASVISRQVERESCR